MMDQKAHLQGVAMTLNISRFDLTEAEYNKLTYEIQIENNDDHNHISREQQGRCGKAAKHDQLPCDGCNAEDWRETGA